MATTATVHSHAAPQGFIRKYVFSLDHKVIGLQYYFLALVAVFVGMFFRLLMRLHMIWPTAVLPVIGDIKPETYLSLLTMHGTIMVFFVLTTAPQSGFGNYFLPIQIGAEDMAFPVLNMLSFWTTFVAFVSHGVGLLRTRRRRRISGWTTTPPLSALPSAGPGEGIRRKSVDHQYCDFLHRVVDGRHQLHRDHSRPARQGMTMMPPAAHLLGLVRHRDSGIAGVRRSAFGRDSVYCSTASRHQLLRPRWADGERPDHGPQRRVASALAALVLVLRASRGLHRDSARHGRDFPDSLDLRAQARSSATAPWSTPSWRSDFWDSWSGAITCS